MFYASYFEGLMIGSGLIIAIGAQNAFVIRQGVKGEHVFAVAAVCTAVDFALIAVGAGGVGTLIAKSPVLTAIAAWGGAAFLAIYGALSLRAAFRPHAGAWNEAERSANEATGKAAGKDDGEGAMKGRHGRARAMIAALGFSVLNPHVYLDTVVMLGGIAAQFDLAPRTFFAAGAMTGSLIWFFAIGYGATRLAPLLRTERGSRLLELTICAVMWIVAARLVIRELG